MIPALRTAKLRLALVALLIMCGRMRAFSDLHLEYRASVTTQASTGRFAPYMLGSWNEGRYAEGSGIWQEAGVFKRPDMSKRFDWSVGLEYIAGVSEKGRYARWDEKTGLWGESSANRNAFRLQQLFGELKYRAVYLTIGMKDTHSLIVDDRLSSGDLTRSNNATPIPGIGAGFIDFVDIPFTKGWLQINGEIMYGKFTDSGFKKKEFNYYSGVMGVDLWYNYKRCFFRTNPNKNFHVTLGMQAAGVFAGDSYSYWEGKIRKVHKRGFKWADFFQMMLPRAGGEDYYTGNHVGSWNLKAEYGFRDNSSIDFYFEWPWEDGSGIGKLNGWDGLWGIQYNFPKNGIVSKMVLEYLDFTNQAGPLHYDPEDKPDSPLTGVAQGADNYYNNDYYGAYANYGMSIGTPFLVSPIYNRSGALNFLHTRARGFHFAIEGSPFPRLNYRLRLGYEKAGGYGMFPVFKRTSTTSGMIEANFKPAKKIPGLEVGLVMAFDKGELRGDNFGAKARITYSGELNLEKSNR